MHSFLEVAAISDLVIFLFILIFKMLQYQQSNLPESLVFFCKISCKICRWVCLFFCCVFFFVCVCVLGPFARWSRLHQSQTAFEGLCEVTQML